jgi:hypothetical protein
MRRIFPFLIVVSMLPVISFGQRQMGLATGNYSPTQALYLNPALLANDKIRFTIDIAGINFGVDNDVASIQSGNAIRAFLGNDSVNINNILHFSDKDKFNMLAPYGELRGPGFMVNIKGKHTIAFTTRVRAMNQFNNFSQQFYRSLVDQTYGESGQDYIIASDKFNWSAQLWSEVGLSYATSYQLSEHSRFKAGITLRYLGGIGYFNALARNIDAHYYKEPDSLRITNTDLQFSSNVIKSSDQITSGLSGSVLGQFFGSKGGHGLGADLGIAYEYTKANEEDYKLRASFSVTDIGSINYNKNNRVAYVRGSGYMIGDEVNDRLDNFEDVKSYAKDHGLDVDSSSAATKMHLPTAMIIGLDYHATKGLYVNATMISSVVNRQTPGNNYYGQLTVTPRYETRLISAGLPITYSALTHKLKMGLGFRLAGIFIGSDDMLAILGSKSQYGLNFYFGGTVPFYRKKKE